MIVIWEKLLTPVSEYLKLGYRIKNAITFSQTGFNALAVIS